MTLPALGEVDENGKARLRELLFLGCQSLSTKLVKEIDESSHTAQEKAVRRAVVSNKRPTSMTLQLVNCLYFQDVTLLWGLGVVANSNPSPPLLRQQRKAKEEVKGDLLSSVRSEASNPHVNPQVGRCPGDCWQRFEGLKV